MSFLLPDKKCESSEENTAVTYVLIVSSLPPDCLWTGALLPLCWFSDASARQHWYFADIFVKLVLQLFGCYL